jgi:hypothetical protein
MNPRAAWAASGLERRDGNLWRNEPNVYSRPASAGRSTARSSPDAVSSDRCRANDRLDACASRRMPRSPSARLLARLLINHGYALGAVGASGIGRSLYFPQPCHAFPQPKCRRTPPHDDGRNLRNPNHFWRSPRYCLAQTA